MSFWHWKEKPAVKREEYIYHIRVNGYGRYIVSVSYAGEPSWDIGKYDSLDAARDAVYSPPESTERYKTFLVETITYTKMG